VVVVKDIHWLAGLAEGEGSFYTYTKKNLRRPLTYPEMTIQSTDYDVIVKAATIMNCHISRVVPYGSSKKRSYKVRVCSTKAIQWMMTLYTLMGIRRREKIREVLDIWRVSFDGRRVRNKKLASQ
jgi:hypothetical protein